MTVKPAWFRCCPDALIRQERCYDHACAFAMSPHWHLTCECGSTWVEFLPREYVNVVGAV